MLLLCYYYFSSLFLLIKSNSILWIWLTLYIYRAFYSRFSPSIYLLYYMIFSGKRWTSSYYRLWGFYRISTKTTLIRSSIELPLLFFCATFHLPIFVWSYTKKTHRFHVFFVHDIERKKRKISVKIKLREKKNNVWIEMKFVSVERFIRCYIVNAILNQNE